MSIMSLLYYCVDMLGENRVGCEGVHVMVVLHPAYFEMTEDKMGVLASPLMDALMTAIVKRVTWWIYQNPPKEVREEVAFNKENGKRKSGTGRQLTNRIIACLGLHAKNE